MRVHKLCYILNELNKCNSIIVEQLKKYLAFTEFYTLIQTWSFEINGLRYDDLLRRKLLRIYDDSLRIYLRRFLRNFCAFYDDKVRKVSIFYGDFFTTHCNDLSYNDFFVSLCAYYDDIVQISSIDYRRSRQ